MYGTQTGIYPGISMAKKCCQRPGTKLSANLGPKWNHTASTFSPQPMPGWHLKVPARHLDKPLDRMLALGVSRLSGFRCTCMIENISQVK